MNLEPEVSSVQFLPQPKQFAKTNKRVWPNPISIFSKIFIIQKKNNPLFHCNLLQCLSWSPWKFATQSALNLSCFLPYMTNLNHCLKTSVQWSSSSLPFNRFLFKRTCSGKLFFEASSKLRVLIYLSLTSSLFFFEVIPLNIFLLLSVITSLSLRASHTFMRFLLLMTKRKLSKLQKYDSGKFGFNEVL